MGMEQNMVLPIPKLVKKVWDVWNLRGCIVLSLSLQVFLMLFASFRQKCRSKLLLVFIWSAYLLADWVAAVAIGVITKSQSDPCGNSKGNADLLAFWASFLLLHLGGPDTITSFALEDNEFWLRHLIGLILQVLAAAYSFYLTLLDNKLQVPTILVFVVGTIKLGERTCALYLASLDRFGETVLPKPDPGPDYEEAVAIYSSMRALEVPTQMVVPLSPNSSGNYYSTVDGNLQESLEDRQLLQEAYRLFESFKGLIVGFLLSSKVREHSREFFLKRNYVSAFKLIEYELGFMYEVLHTKVVVLRHKNKIGCMLRLISCCSIIGALVLFIFVHKHEFREFDIALTCALLLGAISLETISIYKLIFSDWSLIGYNNNIWSKAIAARVLKRRRWSKSVSQYNMIRSCLEERPEWVYTFAGFLGVRGILDKIKIWLFSSSKEVSVQLKKLVFEQLTLKSRKANNRRAAMEACSQAGDWALLLNSNYMKLKWSVAEYQYAESVLLWHIATELYFTTSTKPWDDENKNRQEICKLLSDYMFYLLVMQNKMMAPVLGNWHIVFQDTCAEAKRFFSKKSISDHQKACEEITGVESKFRSAAVKGSKSKSVLFDACILADQLETLEPEPWKLMSRVWVEFLCYASIQCRPVVHAQQRSRGGELLTFTWLLMYHLGLGTQFYELEDQVGTKMVAVK